ncbi:MAG: PSD1 domain-containing protein [Gemmataceae bacterium]|nr:PSD1 domain-containing protein [Gemmataceae bacterium]
MSRLICALFGLSLSGLELAAAPPISYGRDVRPILSENCFFCHGQDPNQRKAELRLDTREGQREGDVVVPGKPNASELVARILATDAKKMPPAKSNRKLTDEQKEILKRWIAEGANFEEHWAFVAPKRPEIPKIDGVSNPIDAFIRSKLAEAKLKSSEPADKVTLIRRVTLDLIGLPPTPEEVDAFVNDASPNAYEKLLDRLFASPHYGERMALPWLDAARYADSNGFQQDGDTFQWVWRDWVVKALNENMPFDRFTIEQLAGDLLPNATLDQKIATAFNRNHLVNGEGGAIPEEQRFNNLFDRVDTTATNWLGLTMACAQCHDHKYDPITQKDYYSLMAAFNNVSESGVAGRQSSKMRVSPPFLEAPTAEHKATLASLDAVVASLKTALAEKRKLWERREKPDEKRKAEFEAKVEPGLVAMLRAAEKELADFRADELPKVMVMADDRPRETHVLDRGEYLKTKEKVSFATPTFLPPLPKDAPKNRLGLARWLVSPEHPLTARVAVNRAWQTFFGAGLVRTSEDFGVQSEVPIHRDLLDWLAVEFRESGWDMKKLHRLIVTSETYKQSSKVTAEQRSIDSENRYLARFPRVRLPAMILRDVALAAGGLLDRRIGGKPVYPYQPDGIWETLAITKERDFTYPKSGINDLHRRSLYTFWRRTVGPANMFDASSRQVCKVKPSVTNTPLHALTTLNDPTWTEAARGLAERTLAKPVDERLTFAFRQVLARSPSERERTILQTMLAKQMELFRKDGAAVKAFLAVGERPANAKLDPVELAAWGSVCLALLNLDEALTRE